MRRRLGVSSAVAGRRLAVPTKGASVMRTTSVSHRLRAAFSVFVALAVVAVLPLGALGQEGPPGDDPVGDAPVFVDSDPLEGDEGVSVLGLPDVVRDPLVERSKASPVDVFEYGALPEFVSTELGRGRAGDVNVVVPVRGASRSEVVGSPVAFEFGSSDRRSLSEVSVRGVDVRVARSVSSVGVAFEVEFSDAKGVRAPDEAFDVELDFLDVALVGGANVIGRLELVWAEGCETVANEELGHGELVCESTRVIPSVVDPVSRTIVGSFDARVAETDLSAGSFSTTSSAAFSPSLSSGGGVIMMMSGSSSGSGDFGATPTPLLSDYQVGLYTGSAQLGYQIPVPPSAGGPTPSVRLGYSSASLDGLFPDANNQLSGVGVGWSLSEASVVRATKACSNDSWLCVAEYSSEPVFTLTLDGVGSRLVETSTSGVWRMQSDSAWHVQQFNAGASSEYWVVRTPDGTKHTFGATVNGRQLAVFGDSSLCGSGICDRAYKWNLETVEDLYDNQIQYVYDKQVNSFDSGSDNDDEYDRSAHLSQILYTVHDGDPAHAMVKFNWELRCGSAASGFGDCSFNGVEAGDPFPDTPTDLACFRSASSCAQDSQSFWTEYRLGSIQTQVRDSASAGWVTTGVHDLAHSFPTPPLVNGYSSESKLMLYRIHPRIGGLYQHYGFSQLEAEDADTLSGLSVTSYPMSDAGVSQAVTSWGSLDYLQFDDVFLGGGTSSGDKADQLIVRLNNTGSSTATVKAFAGTTLLDSETVATGLGWSDITFDFTALSGVHDIKITVDGESSVFVNWIRFGPATFDDIEGLPATDYGAGGWEWLANRANYTGTSPMMLARIDTVRNGLGGEVEFTYGQPETCGDGSPSWSVNHTHCFPGPANGWSIVYNKYVVTQMEASDTFSNNPSMVTSYEYDYPSYRLSQTPGASLNYRNDFRGHRTVTVTDGDGSESTHTFFQGMHGGSGTTGTVYVDGIVDDNWLAGMTRRSVTQTTSSSSSEVAESVSLYSNTLTAGSSTFAARIVRPSVVVNDTYGCSVCDGTTTTTMTYDTYGNMLSRWVQGDLQDRYLSTYFKTANTSLWIVGNVNYTQLRATNSSGATLSKVQYKYDGDGSNWAATPTSPIVDATRTYYSTSNARSTVSDIDTWGRVVATQQAATLTVDKTTMSYHSFHGQLTQTDPPLIAATEISYDDYLRVNTITDPAGLVSTLGYDDYGRLEDGWAPAQPTSGIATVHHDYQMGSFPASVKTTALIDGSSTSISATFVDGFGRQLESQVEALNDSGTTGKRVSTTQYDAQGNAIIVIAPTWDTGTVGTFSGIVSVGTLLHSLTAFDSIGRPTSASQVQGTNTLVTQTTEYDGLATRIWDGNDNKTVYLNDMAGNVLEAKEYSTSSTYAGTSYSYDAAGRLLQVNPPESGDTVTMTYGLAGQKLTMTDPDMGSWEYDYDLKGNLDYQKDGRGKEIELVYDALNRLTEKNDLSNADSLGQWDYHATNGRLLETRSYVADVETVTVTHGYNSLGYPDETTWDLDITGGGILTVGRGFNDTGSMTTKTLPNGEIVTTSISSATGQVTAVSSDTTSFEAAISYVGWGAVSSMVLGTSQAAISYDYETTFRRLQGIEAHTAGNTGDLMDLTYSFDDASNIESVTDANNSSQKQCFGYDHRNRLVDAFTSSICTTANSTGSYSYDQDFTYSLSGNLLTQTGIGTYTYGAGSPGPHAVTSIGSTYSFGYDNNGNMTTRTVPGTIQTLDYNTLNQLETIGDGTLDTNFYYDADGTRVAKIIDGVTTVYIGSGYERSVGPPTAANLLSNGGLETAAWEASNDTDHPNTSNFRGTWGTAEEHSGTYGGQLSNLAYGTLQSSEFTVSEGVEYDVSGWVRGESGAESRGAWIIRISWYDGAVSLGNDYATSGWTFPASWTEKTGSVTAPDDADTAVVELISYMLSGWTSFDDIKVTATGSSVNLVPNPGFETGNWTHLAQTGFEGTHIYRSTWGTSTPKSGSYSTTISNHSYAKLISSEITGITGGSSYTLSARVRGEIAAESSVYGWYLRALWYDSSGTYISNETPSFGFNGANISSSWTTESGTVTAPAGATKLEVEFAHLQATGWVAVDDVTAQLNGTGSNLIQDGSFETSGEWAEWSSNVYPNSVHVRGTDGLAAPDDGNYARSISNVANGQAGSSSVTVGQSQAYDVGMWMRGELNASNSLGNSTIEVVYYDNGTEIGRDTVATHQPGDLTETWEEFHQIVTTPASTDSLRVWVTNEHTSGWVNYDDAYVIAQNTVTETIHYSAAGQRIGVAIGADVSYVFSDHLGSTSTSWNPTDGIDRQYYLPFGAIRHADSMPSDVGYTGQRLDNSTGLMFYNARYYDPSIGRFISPDTIIPNPTNPQDFNRYAYVRNNPLKYTDPTGHCIAWSGRTELDNNSGQDCNMEAYLQNTAGASAPSGDYISNKYGEPDALTPGVGPSGHVVLEVLGLVPVAGEVFDLINGVWYVVEGDKINGGLSFAALVPFAGWAASACKRGCDDVARLAARQSDEVATMATACLRSFSGDTEVLMGDGSTKPISEIVVGDSVWAYDPVTGDGGPRLVTHLWVHEDTLVDFQVGDSWVTTTEDHPWWNETDQQWQASQNLDIGDLVITADGETLPVGGIDWETSATGTAYNLNVDDIHTYFVEVGADQVLVHNCGLDGLAMTLHGRERLLEGGFDALDVQLIRNSPTEFIQADGSIVNVLESSKGLFDYIVTNVNGEVVTAHRNFTARQLANIGENYGWSG